MEVTAELYEYSRCNCSIMHRQNCQEDKVCLLSPATSAGSFDVITRTTAVTLHLFVFLSTSELGTFQLEFLINGKCTLGTSKTNFCPNFLCL